MRYAPAAMIFLINRGPKRAQNQGFLVDLDSGEFPSPDKPARDLRRVALFVHNTRNLLLLRFTQKDWHEDPVIEKSLAYALKRAMEKAFHLEERELEVFAIGQGEHRALLFYEEAEGGVGALRQLVEDSRAFKEAVGEALRLCHFHEETGKTFSVNTTHTLLATSVS